MENIIFGLHCPDCGKDIEESDKHCPHCGINLDAPLEKNELEVLAQQCLEKAQKNFDRRLINWALADCEQALEYMPDMAEAHNLRGLILDEKGKADEALFEYQEAVRLKPNYADAVANLEDAEVEYHNTHELPSIRLWTPGLIGLITFFFGFPGGIALSSINWIKMGLNKKAAFHIVAGVAGTFALVITMLLLPGIQGRGIGALVNFGMLYYLYTQTKKDIEIIRANNYWVEDAHWFGGCLISLFMIGIYFVLVIVAVIFLDIIGLPILE